MVATGLVLTGAAAIVAITSPVQMMRIRDVALDSLNAPSAGRQSGVNIQDDELYLVTASITNDTDFNLALTNARLGHEDGEDGGHWNDRATDVAPGQTITVSAYSAIEGQGINLTYDARSNEGHPAKIYLDSMDPAIGSNNTDGTRCVGPVNIYANISDGRHATADFIISSAE